VAKGSIERALKATQRHTFPRGRKEDHQEEQKASLQKSGRLGYKNL